MYIIRRDKINKLPDIKCKLEYISYDEWQKLSLDEIIKDENNVNRPINIINVNQMRVNIKINEIDCILKYCRYCDAIITVLNIKDNNLNGIMNYNYCPICKYELESAILNIDKDKINYGHVEDIDVTDSTT